MIPPQLGCHLLYVEASFYMEKMEKYGNGGKLHIIVIDKHGG